MRLASVLLLFLCLSLAGSVKAQTTTNCLEVESILVAACVPQGSTEEGLNEMVRILSGPNPLTVSSLTVTWPNNTFNGWVRNATTASKTAQINASITSCGYVLEPLNGIIPANKKAILVTSYNMNPLYNSFANLTDTLYILYQNSAIATGHFRNYAAGNLMRSLRVMYPSCATETVTYNTTLLDDNPGATVVFAQDGTASYVNPGCTAPVSEFSVDAGPSPAAVCPGTGTVTLNGSVTGTPTYRRWSGGTGSFGTPGNNTTTYTLAANQTSSFWLYFKAKGACADTLKDSVLINIQQQNPLVITPGGPTTICNGDNLTLTASGGGGAGTYQWTGGPNSAQYTVNSPGTYVVTSSDACYNYTHSIPVTAGTAPTIHINQADTTICAGAPAFTVTATANGNIAWLPGPVPGNSISITGPGQYIAGVSNGCGVAADTLNVTALPAPSVQITNAEPAGICAGGQLILNATGNGTLTWTPGGSTGNTLTVTTPGQYTVSVTNTCGTATDNITVGVDTPPNVQITNADPASLCPGQTLILNATGNGALSWSNGDLGNNALISAPGNYTVTATNNCGTASDVITVIQGTAPNAQITNNTPIKVCPNTNVTLNGTGAGTLHWSNGGNGNSTVVNQAGTYLLIDQTACGADTAQITVEFYPIDAAFTATPTTGFAPLNVQTDNQSTDNNGSTWVFGDGSANSTEHEPGHTYQQPGTYTLLLAVTNEQGCTDTATVEITVTSQLLVELPNIFTPNGDDVNDVYKIKAVGVSSMRAEIYNRWGEKMFSWNDPDQFWNGKSPLGAPASNGVYMCVVEAIDAMGQKHVYKTTVTLIQ